MRQIARVGLVALLLTMLLVSCVSLSSASEDRLSLIYPEVRPFPESRFTTIFGLTIHYRTWEAEGDQIGKILLIHGIGGSTYSFERLVPYLRQAGYAVAAIDMPGFGFSDPATKFEHTARNRLELVWTLIDRLDTDQNQFNPLQRWYIIGHDMGGEFAVWMANERPGRIAGLVLISTVIGDNRPGGRMTWFPPVRWALRSWYNNSLFTEDGVRELLEDAYGEPPTQDEVDGYLAPLLRPDAAKALVNYARTVGNDVPDLSALTVPVLYLFGSDDTWKSIDDARLQAEQVPESRFEVIQGGGHVPMDTQPSLVSAFVTLWIQSLENGGG